jgi:hypothetical protein
MKSKNNIEKLSSKNDSIPVDEGDELFSPSEKVWKNVAKKLPVKKKKRQVLPIIFGIISLSMVSFIYFSQKSNATQSLERVQSINDRSGEDNIGENLVKLVKAKSFEKTIANVQKKTTFPKSDIVESVDAFMPDKMKKKQIVESGVSTNNSLSGSIEKNSIEGEIKSDNLIQTTTDFRTIEKPSDKEPDTQINELQQLRTEDYVISPVKTLSLRLTREVKTFDMPIKHIEASEAKKSRWMSGLALTMSPLSYRSPQVNDPLEGTIKSSAYKSVVQLSFALNYSLSEHLFLSASPGIRYDQLNTDYDLNIPYDYATEVDNIDKKENYFSHSLPTDLGNIKTKMVVTRASDSPVVHNEKINIDFDVNYKTFSISNPIGVHYAFISKEKGLYAGIRLVPQYVVKRSADVEKYQSKHTYVNGDHVDITIVKNYKNLYLGGDIQAGYRWSILNKKFVLDVNTTYHRNFMSEGRPYDVGVGLALMKSF